VEVALQSHPMMGAISLVRSYPNFKYRIQNKKTERDQSNSKTQVEELRESKLRLLT